MVKKDYIYWESYPEEEFNYIKCLDSEAVDSLDKAIYDDMKKYPKGYYEVEYEFAMDYEYDEFGPAYSYYVLVGIKVLRRRMFVGWLKFFLKRHDPIDYIKKTFWSILESRF